MLTTEDVDPGRVINVCGNTRKAHAPEIACLEHIEAALTSTELKEIKKIVDPAIDTLPRKPKPGPVFQPR